MQLTDAEIRELLLREKRRKKKRQRTRRRITMLALLLIIIIIVAFIKFNPFAGKEPEEEVVPARGVIFIDPGHGGDDPGSDNGARFEKDDTLKLGLAVRTYLEAAGFEVHMSRISDETVERSRRGEMANECKAQLMVSIHRNMAETDGHGVEAFIPSANTSESMLLAENIMKALVAQGFNERSIMAGTLKDPAQDYDEIAAAKMPCCLIEVGFISNMGDNKLFDKKLDTNAKALANAVDSTFKTLYEPEETADGEAADGNDTGKDGSGTDNAKG